MALALLLAAGVASCSTPAAKLPPEPPTERSLRIDEQSLPISVGEELAATVRMFGLTVGKMTMTAGTECAASAGREAEPLHIKSAMKTAGIVRWFKTTSGTMTTTANQASYVPSASDTLVQDGDVERRYDIRFSPKHFEYRFLRNDRRAKQGEWQLPLGEVAYDTQSAFMLLRGWNPKPGTKGFFFVVLGHHLWRTDVTYHGVGEVEIGGKQAQAIKISGTAYRLKEKASDERETRAFTMWLANDGGRVPLLVEGDASYGTLRFALDAHRWLQCKEGGEQLSGESGPVGLTDGPSDHSKRALRL